MKLPKSLTRVTGFSKALALLLTLAFIAVAFYAGIMYQQKYAQIIATITPTPTPIAGTATACTTDSDCVLTTEDVKNSCCPNTRCLRDSDESVVAVSSTWLATVKRSVCGERVMCPMIAMMCTREVVEENSHYSAKCLQHVCTKVRS